jgi:hypothetical protein
MQIYLILVPDHQQDGFKQTGENFETVGWQVEPPHQENSEKWSSEQNW